MSFFHGIPRRAPGLEFHLYIPPGHSRRVSAACAWQYTKRSPLLSQACTNAAVLSAYTSRGRKNQGTGFGVLGTVAGFASSVLFIFLVFSSGDTETHTHLSLTATKILATLTVKANVFICDYLDRKTYPVLNTIPAYVILRRWREVTAGLTLGNSFVLFDRTREPKADRITSFRHR